MLIELDDVIILKIIKLLAVLPKVTWIAGLLFRIIFKNSDRTLSRLNTTYHLRKKGQKMSKKKGFQLLLLSLLKIVFKTSEVSNFRTESISVKVTVSDFGY